MSRFVIKHITVDGYKKKIEYEEEIDSMEACKWSINGICCNEKCDSLGAYTYFPCDDKDVCSCFEKEDGIIEVLE